MQQTLNFFVINSHRIIFLCENIINLVRNCPVIKLLNQATI